MKAWWTKTAWPWLKENWWVLLALPLALLVGISMWLYNVMSGGGLTTIDPTADADERAREEHAKRVEELQHENKRLEEEKAAIQAKYDTLEQEFEQRLVDEVQELRQDPERLRRLMLGIQG